MDADSTPACLTVKIMEADYSVTSATGTERTVRDGTDVLIIVEHGTDDDLTFGNFDDLSIDGKTVGAENYNKENAYNNLMKIAQGALLEKANINL